eukprot:TRINITY_DN7093_c0_g1_i1.p1 TRINITY_DN7093_c0_g1~~TRINITY_DN7093_c0_g1_i1.p1  ORF type:complete len:716 (-),score=194.69 TRINITY_DN7093_c0_g1_i1:14-2161(-)
MNKYKEVLVVCVCFLVSTVVSIGDNGHDRPYGDLPGMPIFFNTNQNENDCASMCDQNTQCKAWAYIPGNCSNADSQCFLKVEVPPVVPASCRISGLKDLTLTPRAFPSFPVGAIVPQGWLWNQLDLQGSGLAGHLSKFWGSINQSAWIGVANGDSFERVPYWLNGLVPMAYMLQDEMLFNQMNFYLDYILAHQGADGWIGPTCCDPWPRFPLLLALMQYHEANPSDDRVIPAIWSFFFRLRDELDQNPLSSWAQYRWQDLVIVIHWLYDNYPQGQEQFLLDFAEEAHNQGFDWAAFFASDQFPEGPCTGSCPSLATHGVNVGQALKSSAVWYRQSKDSADVYSVYERMDRLYEFHGLASGIFGCDEHLAGNMPSHGSELCTVVETMYSLETIVSLIGDASFGDNIERLAYNALPATITADMWAHQYLQQTNEINAAHLDPNIWTTDGPDSNIYGLEPNFGCCTANFDQGWSKFITHMLMRSYDNGIVAVLHGPAVLTTTINGASVTVNETTEYPFDDAIYFNIESGTAFSFHIRVPGWASSATIQIGSNKPIPAPAGQLYTVQVASGATQIILTVPMEFSVERRTNGAASISYGPLLFSLDIPAVWTQLAHYEFNSSDWQAEPAGPWAWAINISDSNPNDFIKMVKKPMGKYPFSVEGTPYTAQVQGCQLDSWGIENNVALPPPTSPVTCTGPMQAATLHPYGVTKLRLSEIPTV